MGGGGSSIPGGGGLRQSKKMIEQDSIKSGQKTEINSYLNDRLIDINQLDTQKINQRKESIFDVLNDEFEDVQDFNTEGSYSRYTYVNGLSDIDILIDLGNYSTSQFENKEDSHFVLQAIAERIKQRYPTTNIKLGKMAVTLEFQDGIELQILPSFKYYNGYKVPDPDSNGWVCSFPDNFKKRLTSLNQSNTGKIVPALKLTKQLLQKQDIKIKSYHIENIALDAFRGYTGSLTPEALIKYLINYSKSAIFNNIGDPCHQSEYIDSYLGKKGSEIRKKLAQKINKLDIKLQNTTTQAEWEKLFQN